MLKICLVFWESEHQYAYKRYAYKKTCIPWLSNSSFVSLVFFDMSLECAYFEIYLQKFFSSLTPNYVFKMLKRLTSSFDKSLPFISYFWLQILGL